VGAWLEGKVPLPEAVAVVPGLAEKPDSGALASFLVAQKASDPFRFPDLSLSIIKLLGPGEYVVESQESVVPGHFGPAVKDYTHSTAPNRRFRARCMWAALWGFEAMARACYARDQSAF